ncbi:hypothetical protein BJ322DRAFT_1032813 [Thelephora terrestris]|uniref:Uncharacterized protein n=1 Tax=Thelephora terrestris TaxID=56493 RepID=A0A9P6HWV4_9AGAM|nr:hypothetical protein BJ322DRAFT_1032813 [Thelephora terrestris]
MVPTVLNFRLLLFFLLIFDFCCAYSSSDLRTSTVFSSQKETSLQSPVTFTTTERITTDIGVFVQTCTITLTPIVVNGANLVREDKTCTVTPDNGNSSALPPPATSTSSSDSLSSTSNSIPSSTDVPPLSGSVSSSTQDGLSSTGVPSSTLPPDSTITSLSSPPSSTSTSSDVVPSSSGPVVVIGVSSVPIPVATPQPDSTDSSTVVSPPSSTAPLPLSQSSSSLLPTVSPTASAENSGAEAPFDPPGKKLEVLPIGLGVFAGVSVIALLVVGIVTYERTKHRKNFRMRRQQEVNNQMGYGPYGTV